MINNSVTSILIINIIYGIIFYDYKVLFSFTKHIAHEIQIGSSGLLSIAEQDQT